VANIQLIFAPTFGEAHCSSVACHGQENSIGLMSTMLPGILVAVEIAIGQYMQLGHAWIIIIIIQRNLYAILGMTRHISSKALISSISCVQFTSCIKRRPQKKKKKITIN
jgi:hypothetical protein